MLMRDYLVIIHISYNLSLYLVRADNDRSSLSFSFTLLLGDILLALVLPTQFFFYNDIIFLDNVTILNFML